MQMDLFFLCGIAFLAGLVDAIVGGGGLIQMPALFIALPPPLAASVGPILGTNKLSSICGTGMAVAHYARRIPIRWQSILPAGIAAFGSAVLGAMVATRLSSQAMKPLILFLLIGVAIYTYAKKDLGTRHAPQFGPQRERALGILLGLAIGFYDGFFGPGTGSFLMFIFIGFFGFSFLVATASPKVVNFATNLSAVLYFAGTGNILYRYAVPMGLCNVLGALVGSRLALLKGNAFIRLFFLVVVGAMILRFGYDLLVR